MKQLLASFALVVAACGPMMKPPAGGGGGGSAGGGSAVAVGSGSAAAGSIDPHNAGVPGTFAFAEMKFFLGEDLGLQLHADGGMEENSAEPGKPPQWMSMGKLTTDGRLLAPTGAELGGVQPDGTFKSTRGEVAPWKIVGETLVIADKTLSIDANGVFHGGGEGDKQLRIEGTTDAGTRRAALFMLALAFSEGGDDQNAGSAAPPAPPR